MGMTGSWLRIAFMATAIPVFFIFTDVHPESWWPAAVAVALGYLFGRYTCDTATKSEGFWLTVTLFAGLNLLHSTIDGISLVGIRNAWSGIGAVAGHELVRQPALFVVAWAMLEPFGTRRMYRKVLATIVAVTGVWAVGLALGHLGGAWVSQFEWMRTILGYAVFLFLGDIAHHIVDEVTKLRGAHRHEH